MDRFVKNEIVSLISGAPLDAAGETAARERNWSR